MNMKYFVRPWGDGYGIWHGWRWFRWRVVGVGPFGSDQPWINKCYADEKAAWLARGEGVDPS